MTAVRVLEGFVPFVKKLECSNSQHTYMFFSRRTIQSNVNYQLVWCFPDNQDTSYEDCFLDFAGPNEFTT